MQRHKVSLALVFMQIIGLYAEVQLPTSTSLPQPVVDDSVQYSTPGVSSLTPAADQSTEEAEGAVGGSGGNVPEERSLHPLGEHHSTPFPSCVCKLVYHIVDTATNKTTCVSPSKYSPVFLSAMCAC